ncbi:uncharacterized protein [Gossypium hirsutum]|uniref:G-patch domain-containing protein n=1 Tax=Gossypium hirsutum TaxID=3635 RepID=A0ABM3AT72_GOSHI|nr:uncharacterized protein LOC121222067 [Gossypium hirsutum]
MGVVKLDDSPKTEKLLPDHNGVNMIGGSMGRKIKEDIAEVKIPLRWGHEIQECTEFRVLVQGMMDNKEMEFYEEVKEEKSICTSESTKVPRVTQPMVIISRPKNNEVRTPVMLRIIIKKHATFSYQDSRRVLWNYECNTTVPGKETAKDQGVSADPEPVKGKAIAVELKRKVAEPVLSINDPMKEEEAVEFHKILKHSEYSVVEQLHKQPARTSLVNNISADNFIFFNDDEISPGGMGSTKALHITTRCKGYTLLGVLIDNGSTLNVLPLSTLNRLPIDSSHMKTCQNIVRAFDGTEKKVIERIEIPLLIGPTVYEVDFLVMDIKPSYNCLLGRPWIHSVGVIPSSLHQKLKLVSEGQLVTINAEEDIITTVSNETPYMETNHKAVECSFRSLEFVNAIFIPERSKILVPKISKTTEMGLQLLLGKRALPRRGLGKYLQGKIVVRALKEKQENFGLGYKPDRGQKKKELEKRQERRKACLSREETKWEPMMIPHISRMFLSGGVIHSDRRILMEESIEEILENVHINAICEGTKEEGILSNICPYEPESVLDN